MASRFSEMDMILINNDGKDELAITGREVSFPDAFRFKGAAPEVRIASLFTTEVFCML